MFEKRTFVKLDSCTTGQMQDGSLFDRTFVEWRIQETTVVLRDICITHDCKNKVCCTKGCVQAAFTSVHVYKCPFFNSPLYRCPVVQLSGFTCVRCTTVRWTNIWLYKCLVVHVSVVQQMSGCTNVQSYMCPLYKRPAVQMIGCISGRCTNGFTTTARWTCVPCTGVRVPMRLMDFYRTGDHPLPEPMVSQFTDRYMRHRALIC